MHISEVPEFIAKSPRVTTHAVELTDPINTTHPIIIPLQLCSGTSYFDMYSPSVAEHENKMIPKIHLTAKKCPWDTATEDYSE